MRKLLSYIGKKAQINVNSEKSVWAKVVTQKLWFFKTLGTNNIFSSTRMEVIRFDHPVFVSLTDKDIARSLLCHHSF